MIAADGLLKSPLKLIGAKTGIEKNSARRRIYDLIPDGTRTYIEPFLGSGGILIGKKPHAVEHVNDLNWWAINFFRCLQDRPWDVFEDDKHGEWDFARFIGERARDIMLSSPPLYGGNARSAKLRFRKLFIQIAALAVAAVESIDRKGY